MQVTTIIIEGPDGAGKSTLAKELQSVFGFPIVHTGGPLNSRAEFESRVEDLKLLAPEFSSIFDRTPFISDQVYALLSDRLPFVTMEDLKFMIDKVDPIIIYCRLSSSYKMRQHIDRSVKTHKSPEYMKKVIANHPFITDQYDLLMDKIGEDVLWHDWGMETLPDLVAQISRRRKMCAV